MFSKKLYGRTEEWSYLSELPLNHQQTVQKVLVIFQFLLLLVTILETWEKSVAEGLSFPFPSDLNGFSSSLDETKYEPGCEIMRVQLEEEDKSSNLVGVGIVVYRATLHGIHV